MPLSASSSGTVTRASTSAAESPSATVWISTRGGANSGNTSTGMSRIRPRPEDHHPPRRPGRGSETSGSTRRSSASWWGSSRVSSVQLTASVATTNTGVDAPQLRRSDGDDRRANGRAGREVRIIALDPLDLDLLADEVTALGICVDRAGPCPPCRTREPRTELPCPVPAAETAPVAMPRRSAALADSVNRLIPEASFFSTRTGESSETMRGPGARR